MTITGGEPLLSDKFKDFYAAAFRLNFLVDVQTNASLLTEEHLRMFSKQPPRKIVVTLYGMSERSYQAFCGRACFENVKENIKRMANIGLNIAIRVVLTKSNYSELGKMREFANSLGCHFALFRTLIPEARFGFSQMQYQISPEQYVGSLAMSFLFFA